MKVFRIKAKDVRVGFKNECPLFVMPFYHLHWCHNKPVNLQKKHLQTTKALNAVSKIKVQTQKRMTREGITYKHKTNKYRSEAEPHKTPTFQLRSRIPKNIWNHDRRSDWHFQKNYSSCQAKVCPKKIKLIQVAVTGSHTRNFKHVLSG